MNCTNCGAEIKDGVKFCTNCGANLSQQTAQSEPEQEQTPTESMDVPATPEGAVPLQKRNTQRTIAIACGVLILLVVVFVGGLFLWKSLTPKELLLDADTIKDEAILNTLTVKYDKDGDGKLSEEELDEVQTLELDSGDDYSFLPFFKNLSSITVKSSDVTSLDLSENSNLKSADFSNASNITDIKLPDMITYDEVKLPDNENLKVSLPENSEYEVKYVPKKVEETTKNATIVTEQTIENAFKVTDLKVSRDGDTTTYNFIYDSTGRVSKTKSSYNSSNSTQTLTYDERNRLTNEKFNAGTYSYYNGNYPIEYKGENTVTKVKNETVEYADGKIEEKGSSDHIISRWKTDGAKTTSYVTHVGNNSYYQQHDYSIGENSKCMQETIYTYLVTGHTPDSDRIDQTSIVKITYAYDGDRLASASFDCGFVQNYEYDARGNLVKITSTGADTLNLNYTTASVTCSVKYAMVFGKKSQTPLSFIVLPGVNKRGLVNLGVDTRQIAVSNGFASNEFVGKFWWDEENIINNQVEASGNKKSAQQEETSSVGNVEVEEHTVNVSVPIDSTSSTAGQREDATWNYDLLTNPNGSKSIDKINSTIQNSIDKSVDKAEATSSVSSSGGVVMSRSLKIGYLNENVACFVDSNLWYGGGTHGSKIRGSILFNLKTGETIDFATYLGITQDELLSEVKQAVSLNLTNKPSDIDSKDKVVTAVKLEQSSSLDNGLDGLTKLAFNQAGVLYYMTEDYEIGSYALGVRNIVVKAENASDVGKNLSEIEG